VGYDAGSMSRASFPVTVLIVAAVAGSAQSPAERRGAVGAGKFDEFEVASIKLAEPNAVGRYIRMQGAHQFLAWNHALKTLIAAAYNLSPRAISGGPAWIESGHYNIVAKTPTDLRPNWDEQMAMLRKLLADRFQLTFHREPKELSIYALTVAKGGPKLTPTAISPDSFPEGPPPLIFVVSPELVRLPARYATMGDLASVMQRAALDHPVVDQTGLTARYDFDLEFAPDETLFGGALGKGENATKPGLFRALAEQLGLKLQATKGPVDVLVVDHAGRPSEN